MALEITVQCFTVMVADLGADVGCVSMAGRVTVVKALPQGACQARVGHVLAIQALAGQTLDGYYSRSAQLIWGLGLGPAPALMWGLCLGRGWAGGCCPFGQSLKAQCQT